MKRHLLHIWAVLVVVAVVPSSVYGFSATAQVDRTQISMSDTVRLQVVVDGGDADVDTSAIKDFDILSSGTESSRSYINGTWKHQVTYLYQLAPGKTGVLRIPPLRVTGDDDTVVTKEIQIRCEKSASEAPSGPGFEAKAELDTTHAVPGQQVVYTLRLFSPGSFAGADVNQPAFKGLDVRELTKWKKYTRTVNGQAMVVNEIKFLIQAPKPGTYDIEPAIFTAREAVRQDRRPGTRDPFDSFFNDPFFNQVQTRPVRVVSNSLSLEVRPLPTYDGDTSFSGLVGEFTMAGSLDKERVAAGDSVTLSIVVQGRGNIMDIGTMAPRLDDSLFKVYPDTPVEDITPTDRGLAGKKTFRLALVPKQPGTAKIPPVALTFFDPAENRYKTIATKPLTLEVIPGTGAEAGAAKDASTKVASAGNFGQAPVQKKSVTLKNRDILEIKEDISAITSISRIDPLWFIFWLILPGVCFGVFALILRQKQRLPDKRTQARKKAEQLIRKAESVGVADPAFLPALQSGLTALILSRAGKEGETLTQAEAGTLLEETGTDPSTAVQVLEMMGSLDQARFGGKAMDDTSGRQCLAQIQTWVKTLVVLVFAVVAVCVASSHVQASEPATRFVDAVRDYKAGKFDQAARAFESIAKNGVENPALYYNIGNAWLRSRNLGRAVLWYERALRLAPADPDIRFNLAYAQSQVKDRIDRPLTAWDILFFWKGLISLKGLQTAAIAGSFLFFIWAGFQMVRKQKVLNSIGMILFSVFILLTTAAFLEQARLESETRAVILKDQVAVRSGTLETATPLFDLHMGTRVRVLAKKGNHIKISIAGDKVGWITLADAEII